MGSVEVGDGGERGDGAGAGEETLTAARAAWHHASALVVAPAKLSKQRLVGAVAASLARIRREKERQTVHEQLAHKDEALHAELVESRREYRAIEAARRRAEGRLARELAFRKRLHASLHAVKGGTTPLADAAEQEWVEVMQSLHDRAELEAVHYQEDLKQALSDTSQVRAARFASDVILAFQQQACVLTPSMGSRAHSLKILSP